jgi:soluble P-type ATPase
LTVHVPVPGGQELVLEHLVLDVNGTLTDRGEPIIAAVRALQCLAEHLQLHLLTADTFGTAAALAASLDCEFHKVDSAEDKHSHIGALGAHRCVAVGNGRNDRLMLRAAALGIAVIGPEGLHADALAAADILALSIDEALGLLTEPRTLTATLRP